MGVGTLHGWQAGMTAPVELGELADLDSVYLEAPGGDWDARRRRSTTKRLATTRLTI